MLAWHDSGPWKRTTVTSDETRRMTSRRRTSTTSHRRTTCRPRSCPSWAQARELLHEFAHAAPAVGAVKAINLISGLPSVQFLSYDGTRAAEGPTECSAANARQASQTHDKEMDVMHSVQRGRSGRRPCTPARTPPSVSLPPVGPAPVVATLSAGRRALPHGGRVRRWARGCEDGAGSVRLAPACPERMPAPRGA